MFQVVLEEKASKTSASHVPVKHKTEGIEILSFFIFIVLDF